MTWEHLGHVSGATIGLVYVLGLMFGMGYNLFTGWAEARGYLRGYTALAVVGGVLVTLALTAVIDLQFALLTGGTFVFTGTPMIIGSIWRHVREREADLMRMRQAAREEAGDGDAS